MVILQFQQCPYVALPSLAQCSIACQTRISSPVHNVCVLVNSALVLHAKYFTSSKSRESMKALIFAHRHTFTHRYTHTHTHTPGMGEGEVDRAEVLLRPQLEKYPDVSNKNFTSFLLPFVVRPPLQGTMERATNDKL